MYLLCLHFINRDGFYYLTDFSYFSVKLQDSQNRSKMTFLKGGVDGFRYFQLFYFLFSCLGDVLS